jgi:hypothetical protein
MTHNCLLTTRQVAERLGVDHEHVLSWAAKRLLPISGQTEEGIPLIRAAIVETVGEALVSGVPKNLRSPRLRRLLADKDQPRVLPCGCAFATATESDPVFLCYGARSLESAMRLAAALAAVAPRDAFFQRLAQVSAEAFARHLAALGYMAPAGPGKDPGAAAKSAGGASASYSPGSGPGLALCIGLRPEAPAL